MPYSVLLSKGSPATCAVKMLWNWANQCLDTSEANAAFLRAAKKANWMRMCGPMVASIMELCLASSRVDRADSPESDASVRGIARGVIGSMSPELAAMHAANTTRDDLEPGIRWRRLATSVQGIQESLGRFIETGKKTLSAPAGFFGKLGRLFSPGGAVVAEDVQQMETALAKLGSLQRELRSVIEEMEKN